MIHRTSVAGPESLAWLDTCLRILEPVGCAVTARFEAIAMMTGVVTFFDRSQTTSRPFTVAGADLAAYPHLAAAFAHPQSPLPRTASSTGPSESCSPGC